MTVVQLDPVAVFRDGTVPALGGIKHLKWGKRGSARHWCFLELARFHRWSTLLRQLCYKLNVSTNPDLPAFYECPLSAIQHHFVVPALSLVQRRAQDMTDFAISVSEWEEITEKQALDEQWDQIPTLTAFAKTRDFCKTLETHRPQLEALIARHLGIPLTDFDLLGQDNWIWGSFNICLQLNIRRTPRTSKLPLQAILRFPLPFRCGEEYSPGNVEEKLRCEAATYIWLQRNCPSIPTPRLLAMGFPRAESVCLLPFTRLPSSKTRRF